MKSGFKITAVTVVLVLVILFSLNTVFAAEPGSEQDPVITKAYVDAVATQLVAGMQKLQEQFDALKTENTQLTTKLAAQEQSNKLLQDQLNSLKADIAAGKVTSGNTGNTGKPSSSGGTVTNPPASIGKATVNTAVLNIRKQANTTSAIVAKAAMGDSLTLVSKAGDWYKVTTSKGITGYVMTKLITIKK